MHVLRMAANKVTAVRVGTLANSSRRRGKLGAVELALAALFSILH